MHIIKVVNLNKSFQDKIVLNNLSLNVERGEFLSVMGESGSGKSTLLNCICLNETPDNGSIYINEQDITLLTKKQLALLRRSTLGYVYQFFNLVSTLSVKDNILITAELNRLDQKTSKERLDKYANYVGINTILNKFPNQISGGEQQRTAIARSLMANPEILLLDEPTGNLDSKNAQSVMELLSFINKELKTTIVQVTHSMKAANYGSRIIRLVDGVIE